MSVKISSNIIAYEDILDSMYFNPQSSSTEQIEQIISKNNSKFVAIGNFKIGSKELIDKLARVELVLLKQGETAAERKWRELGLPEVKYYS